MFRHKTAVVPADVKKVEKDEEKIEAKIDTKSDVVVKAPAAVTEATIKELLEKNLKWSQIIYEQNRKINNKLLWASIGGWIKIVLIVVPLVLAVIFLAPMAKNLTSFYSEMLTTTNPVLKSSDSLEQIMKLLPINSAQQEQIKAIIK